ncbi:prenyltransferase/squalene oxidase repeat-containing protein [Streptomyces goshikiensis]|uniref:prenyltransferase/squalene oxidase repeat-containing protein n=1 Tax=Streptomyces goshikiensis TaxID=1942 RepID=UPI003669588E
MELRAVEEFLAQAPDFTGPRKRALLDAVLHLLGVTSATAEPPAPAAFSSRGLHLWARVQVTAVKVVLAHASGAIAYVHEDDVALLRSTQHPGIVWEGNLLIHLSVLHALTLMPGHDQLVGQGIRTALAHQRPDGGMPFICDEDTWITATAGVALHAAGAGQPALDSIARRLLALQQPDGGWSYSQRAQLTDVDCTSAAVEVLHLAGAQAHHASIRRAIDALHTVRGKDGGFPTYLAGAPSEAGMTAAAANALTTQGGSQHVTVDAALGYLSAVQHVDGSFPPDWSSSRLHTVFRAALAATRHPAAPGSRGHAVARRCQALVLGSQNSDGGWGQQDGAASDTLSTAYALITLTTRPDHTAPAVVGRGVAYLLAQQREDGSVRSVPDSIGPRPFPFTVPVLADVFTLLALGHLTHRTTPGPPGTGQERDRARGRPVSRV